MEVKTIYLMIDSSNYLLTITFSEMSKTFLQTYIPANNNE
jgi:hypothetical protein